MNIPFDTIVPWNVCHYHRLHTLLLHNDTAVSAGGRVWSTEGHRATHWNRPRKPANTQLPTNSGTIWKVEQRGMHTICVLWWSTLTFLWMPIHIGPTRAVLCPLWQYSCVNSECCDINVMCDRTSLTLTYMCEGGALWNHVWATVSRVRWTG